MRKKGLLEAFRSRSVRVVVLLPFDGESKFMLVVQADPLDPSLIFM